MEAIQRERISSSGTFVNVHLVTNRYHQQMLALRALLGADLITRGFRVSSATGR